MKRNFLLVTLILITISVRGQIYFQQDFNSSDNLADYYKKTAPSKNQFNDIKAVGNTTVGIHNHKLRIEKRVKTPENQTNPLVGVSRQTPFEGAPENGPQFLKFTAEITVSRNPAMDVNDGFAFYFLGLTNLGATGPSAKTRHSYIAIDPRSKEGDFRIRMNGKTSPTLSGTYTIIAYINNSGNTVNYKAPNNAVMTLVDDELDLWTVDKNGTVKLTLSQVPARDPEGSLRNFKIAANPNFTSVLDVDNILLAEEPVINK